MLIIRFGITRRVLATIASTATLTMLAGCGGGGDSPPTSAPPAATVSSITVSAASAAPLASIGETRALTAVARDAGGATLASPNLTWTSSAPAVATVVGSGATATVTAVGNGSATITATSGTVQGTVPVTVAQSVAALVASGLAVTLTPGATGQLSVQARDARGTNVANATTFTFASSDPGVAVVSATGLVTAIAPGSVQVTSSFTQSGATVNATSGLTVAFATSQPSTASVNATNQNLFTPQTVNIATGGTVSWTFGTVVHNVFFASAAGAPPNIANTSSTTVSRTFGTAGTFNYDCTLHPGMVGSVVVGGSGSGPSFTALLNGANERPNPAMTSANGAAAFTVNGGTVSYVVTFSRLSGAPQGAHIHAPASASQNAAVIVDFPTSGQTGTSGVLTGTFTAANIRNAAVSFDSLTTLLRTGNAYVNVHTAQFPGGEIRGQTRVP